MLSVRVIGNSVFKYREPLVLQLEVNLPETPGERRTPPAVLRIRPLVLSLCIVERGEETDDFQVRARPLADPDPVGFDPAPVSRTMQGLGAKLEHAHRPAPDQLEVNRGKLTHVLLPGRVISSDLSSRKRSITDEALGWKQEMRKWIDA
jgi:hypothetical protein